VFLGWAAGVLGVVDGKAQRRAPSNALFADVMNRAREIAGHKLARIVN